MSFQTLIVAGYLANDVEVKTLDGGAMITKFSIPVNEKWDGGEHCEWFNVDTFGKTAENCAKYLAKGSAVVVEGTLRTREHEGKKYMTLRAQTVRFLSKPVQRAAPEPISAQRDEPSLDKIPF